MISSSSAESTLTDKHFSALSSQDLVTIVSMLLHGLCLLTQCSVLLSIKDSNMYFSGASI